MQYKNENNTWFSSVLTYFYRRVWLPGDHTRLKVWYNPCIIRQYIHGKTDETHVLFSNYKLWDGNSLYICADDYLPRTEQWQC